MDHDANCALEETYEWAREDGNEAIKTVISMLSPTAAAETSSFMVDTSVCGLTIQTEPQQRTTALLPLNPTAQLRERGLDSIGKSHFPLSWQQTFRPSH